MTEDPRTLLANASDAALAQRARLLKQVSATRDRLMPARLIDDAKAGARAQVSALKQDSIAHVRAHPFLTALGVTALAAWVVRKPLLAHGPDALKNGYDWLSGKLAFSELDLERDDDHSDRANYDPADNDTEGNSP